MEQKTTYEITEIIELYEVDEIFICECMDREWIIPVDPRKNHLDGEDIARMLLIKDLKREFGVNDEAVPIILHLVDQLHWSQVHLKRYLAHLAGKED